MYRRIRKNFQIDFDALEARLNIHTKGVIINSPNNPSGAVYSEQTIEKLAELLTKKSKEFGTHIFIITDEPYREIVYDGVEVPYVTKYYNDTLVCYSYSKSLSFRVSELDLCWCRTKHTKVVKCMRQSAERAGL